MCYVETSESLMKKKDDTRRNVEATEYIMKYIALIIKLKLASNSWVLFRQKVKSIASAVYIGMC